MSLTAKKLYLFLSVALLAGYVWVCYQYFSDPAGKGSNFEPCLIKQVTNLPCPACGSTRAVISLLHGNISEALALNPLGIVIALIMVITPPWILFDVLTKKESLLAFYYKTEVFLRKPGIAIPLIALVIVNWIWNISKGL